MPEALASKKSRKPRFASKDCKMQYTAPDAQLTPRTGAEQINVYRKFGLFRLHEAIPRFAQPPVEVSDSLPLSHLCVLCVLSWLFNPGFHGHKGALRRAQGLEPRDRFGA